MYKNLAPIKAVIAEYVAKGWFDFNPKIKGFHLNYKSEPTKFWKAVENTIGYWRGNTEQLLNAYPDLRNIPKLHRYLYSIGEENEPGTEK